MEDKWQEDKWRNDGKPGDREWRRWEDFIASPWEPPASLEAALSKVHGPRVWLGHAVDSMAFGDEGAPIDPEDQTKKRGYIMEVAARRCRASRALCRAAQSAALTVIGAGDHDSDANEKISSDYFDTPRQLGSENNSLETDPDRIPAERPMSARHGHTKWFNVRIETAGFLDWLIRNGAAPTEEKGHPTRNEVLEEAAKELETFNTNDIYKKALRLGAKMIRALKSDDTGS